MEPQRSWQSRLAEYLSWSSSRDGRWILPVILVMYFATLLALQGARGRVAAWETLGVSGGSLSFVDTRFIAATMQSQREGHDPFVENPVDPWGRRMNYPRVWLALAPLGLAERHTVPAAIGLAAVYFACLLCWAGRVNPAQALVLGAFLCAPHIMWVVERGNVDMVILILLAGALTLVRCKARLRPLLMASVLVAGILKLYPIAGIWVAARDRWWRAIAWIAGTVAIFCIYLYLTWSDVMRTFEFTPRWTWWSYGRNVAFEVMARLLRLWTGFEIGPQLLAAASVIAVAVTGLVAGLLSLRLKPVPTSAPAHIDGFLIASGIYAGTFLIGTNFDYKLIFLVLLLPQVFDWLRDRGGFRLPAYLLLGAVMLSIWPESLATWLRQRDSSRPSATGELVQEMGNWLLLLLLMAINLRLVIQWAKGSGPNASREEQNSTSGRAGGAA